MESALSLYYQTGLQTQQSLNFCSLSKGWGWGWSDNSAVQGTCCYCKGPWFSSQLTMVHNSEARTSNPLSGLYGTHTYMQHTHAHKTKINKSFFKAWGFDACFETSHVAQSQIFSVSEGSFKLLILLPLPPECWGSGMSHHAQFYAVPYIIQSFLHTRQRLSTEPYPQPPKVWSLASDLCSPVQHVTMRQSLRWFPITAVSCYPHFFMVLSSSKLWVRP